MDTFAVNYEASLPDKLEQAWNLRSIKGSRTASMENEIRN